MFFSSNELRVVSHYAAIDCSTILFMSGSRLFLFRGGYNLFFQCNGWTLITCTNFPQLNPPLLCGKNSMDMDKRHRFFFANLHILILENVSSQNRRWSMTQTMHWMKYNVQSSLIVNSSLKVKTMVLIINVMIL